MQSEESNEAFQIQINNSLKNYINLSKDEQDQCRIQVLKQIKNQITIFEEKIQFSKVDLKCLNLIVGTTGAGKSTLFNYLNDIPLLVTKKTFQNNDAQVVEGSKPILVVNEEKLRKTKAFSSYAQISSGCVSETSIPNFCQSKTGNVAYVDCAGEFDNKYIIQSIINSFFKYKLAKDAKKVKLTIVFDYHSLSADRGNAFKKLIHQVSNFVGLWDEFAKSKCVSFVITNAPRKKNIKNEILAQLRTLSINAKDLGKIKSILQDVTDRKALAVFLSPPLKVINKQEVSQGQEAITQVDDGAVYQPEQYLSKQLISSPQIITKTLEETNFINAKPELFVQNLQHSARIVVDAICQDLLINLQQCLLNVFKQQILENAENNTQKQIYFQQQKKKLSKSKNIQEFIENFGLTPQKLADYNKNLQDFYQFQKISNIVNADKKLLNAMEKLKGFINEQLTSVLLADNQQRDKKLEQYKITLQKKSEQFQKKQQNVQKLLKELEIKNSQLQKQSAVCSLKMRNERNGEWNSKIYFQNQTDFTFDKIFIKLGRNFDTKDNTEFLRPTVVEINNVPPGGKANFNLAFFSKGPSTTGNVFKILGLGLAKMAWGKDYWQVEGIKLKDGFRTFTTTRSDRWFTDIKKQDDIAYMRIKNFGGSYKVQMSRSSGITTRDFESCTYGSMKQDGWST